MWRNNLILAAVKTMDYNPSKENEETLCTCGFFAE